MNPALPHFRNMIFNEDVFETIARLRMFSPLNCNPIVDLILTSPPYNTSRAGAKTDLYASRYDEYIDEMTDEEYIQWTNSLFSSYNLILKPNGAVLYNLSYSSENTDLIWKVIGSIIANTPFTVADCIIWKKQNALPNNRSSNKLTRIVEYIFVLCRKTEIDTFNCYKPVATITEKTGQKNFVNVFNFIETANNDGSTDLNKATFSTDLVVWLLKLYSKKDDLVYDSFMGTGTTAVGCAKAGVFYMGSEKSAAQCEYAEKRIHSKTIQRNMWD